MNDIQFKTMLSFFEFTAWVIGPDYEIVVFDVKDGHANCVKVFNDYGGVPICKASLEFVEKVVEEKKYVKREYILHRLNRTDEGKPFRCSAFFVKNSSGELTNVVAINFDQKRYEKVMHEIVDLCHPDRFLNNAEYVITELRTDNVNNNSSNQPYSGSMNSLIRELSGEKRISDLSPTEKRKIVRELKRQGVFNVKGSIKKVAEILYCSPSTIYRYIGS